MRRVMMRVIIDRMIGPTFLQCDGALEVLSNFMTFQDQLEDATAKAVILPRWLSLPLFLWPVQRRRQVLQTQIRKILSTMVRDIDTNDASPLGWWLQQHIDSKRYSLEEIAELVVGLWFAAHKNPSIGATQAYLFLWERATQHDRQACYKEAQRLAEQSTASMKTSTYTETLQSCTALHKVCIETLRLTAHTIGAIRIAKEDIRLNETKYTIRKGETLALSHIGISLDDAIWSRTRNHSNGDNSNDEDSNERKNRQNDKSASDFDTSRPIEWYQDDYQFSVFSQGIHKCPGQRLAVTMMQLALATLLADYTISWDQTKIPSVSFERATLAQRHGPVAVTIKPKG